MPGDLHTHSTCSDGSTPIQKLPFLAAGAGLRYLAISDHDSMLSVRYAYAHPQQQGVTLIPAAELTAYDYEREHRVHLLCYWPDDCAALAAHCDEMGRRRTAACMQSARELEALCPQFLAGNALAHSRDAGVLYKAHIMRELYEIGQADGIYGKTYLELFALRPVPGRIIHTPQYQTVDEVLATARAARAVVVFAHPSVYHSMPLVRELAAAGAIDGLEIEHPRNTPEDKAELYRLAEQYGLIVTGGTDYHGFLTKTPHPVGFCTTADGQVERITALAQKRKKA